MVGLAVTVAIIGAVTLVILGFVMTKRLLPVDPAEDVGDLAEKVPWRTWLSDGVVLIEGNRLLSAWRIQGADLQSLSYEAQAKAIAMAAGGVLEGVGAEVTGLDFEIFREAEVGYPYEPIAPRDATSAAMFEARRRFFEQFGKQYDNEAFLALVWTPPGALASAFERLATEQVGDEALDSAAAQLRRVMADVESAIGVAWDVEHVDAGRWKMQRLNMKEVELPQGPTQVEELLGFLQRTFTHEKRHVAVPETAMVASHFKAQIALDRGALADQDLETTFTPKIGDNYFEVVTLETFRHGGTTPNALAGILGLPMPLRVSVRALIASDDDVEKRATKRFNMFQTNSDKRANKRRNKAAERKASAAHDVDTSANRYFHWNVKVVVCGTTAAAANTAARRVKAMLHKSGFGARIERIGNPSALASTWPGNVTDDRSESLIDQVTLMDIAPLNAIYRGPAEHPNPSAALDYNPPTMRARGLGNTPVDVYDTVQDVAHMGSIGPIGTGKSTLSNGLIYLDRATTPDIDHLIIDQGYSAQAIVEAFGGRFNDPSPSNEATGTCPLDRIEDPEELEIFLSWILDSLHRAGVAIGDQREEHLRRACMLAAKSSRRSMSLFQGKLATYDNDLAAALTPWTMRGAGGFLFDREFTAQMTDEETDQLECYEMSRLMRYRDDRLTAPLITLAFNRLLRRNFNTTRRIRVHLDEPVDYFDHPVAVKILAGYYDKIARKNGGGVRMFTQHPQQFLASEIAPSVLNGTKSWFLFPNAEAGTTQRQIYKDSFGINDEICNMLANTQRFQPKKHVGLWQQGHFSILNPSWQPEELAWIGATGKNDRKAISDLRDAHPDDYQRRRFEALGLAAAAKRWTEISRTIKGAAHASQVA